MPEIWKPVVGAECVYEVSNHGRCRRILPGRATHPGRILKAQVRRKDRRVTVSMIVDGRNRTNSVHRIVARAFLGECPAGKEVNHIDGNPTNNCANNLEYVTRRDNMLHAFKLGLRTAARGEQQHLSKLTTEQAYVIRHCTAPTRLIARVFNVSRSTVAHIKKCRTWTHIG